MSQRDTGWIQFYQESNQEVLDTVLTASRLVEDPEIRLPAMVNEDAFYLSHTFEPVDVPDPKVVDTFLPPKDARAILRPGVVSRLGSFTGPDHYVDFRHQVAEAMDRVLPKLQEVESEYARLSGRDLGGPLVGYRTEDADAVLLTLGTISTTARGVVDELRSSGQKVGMAKLRVFRPFPVEAVRALARDVSRLGVLDRSFTFGSSGPAASEVRSALYGVPSPPSVTSFLAGIGGRDVGPKDLHRVFQALLSSRSTGPRWMDLETDGGVVVHG
jgi:pyruvate/2-oxoacid:ferredoxin oxidoreductase alpha subunit